MITDATGNGNWETKDRPSVVIVDDEALLAHALAERLSIDGISVTVATDAAQGLDLCAARRFHAAFVDLKLPDGDGASVAAMFKQQHPSTYVVVMTGFATGVDDPVLSNVQADTVLPKPWNPRELRAIVQIILKKAD